MTDAAGDGDGLFSRDARRREELLTAFEEAWFRGEPPEIGAYLGESHSGSESLLVELALIDLEMRLKRSQPIRAEWYLERHPRLGSNREAVLRLLHSEFDLRRREDPSLSASEYLRRFPGFAQELRETLPNASRADEAAEPPAPRPVVTIRVIDGPHRGLEHRCEGHQTLVAGRSASAQLRLNKDRHFSRFHFLLEIAPPDVQVIDLGSRNGTAVNGVRVRSARLSNGDVVSGGLTRISVSVTSGRGLWALAGMNPATAGEGEGRGMALPPGLGGEGPKQLPAVPGYELIDEIGRGPLGRVYRAVQAETGRPVAVKFILPARAQDFDAPRQFVREANLLNRLDHPVILRTHEVGLVQGLPYLVTDDFAAEQADSVLGALQEPRRTRVACGIACDLLDALDHAHHLGLVHGDLKPSSVLLARSGRKLQVKLADFGLARISLDAGFSGVLDEEERRDEIAFLAPERILDCRAAVPAGDIYGVGVLLYLMLAGQLPFEFRPGRTRYAAVLDDAPIPLGQLRPDLPPELTAHVHRAIAKAATLRFATAATMRDAVQPFSRQ